MTQEHYIDEKLNEFGMMESRGAWFPLPNDKIPEFSQEKGIYRCPYQELVGSQQYLVAWSRPDIAYATSKLAEFTKDHNEIHWTLSKHVLRYLKRTKKNSLELGCTGS